MLSCYVLCMYAKTQIPCDVMGNAFTLKSLCWSVIPRQWHDECTTCGEARSARACWDAANLPVQGKAGGSGEKEERKKRREKENGRKRK